MGIGKCLSFNVTYKSQIDLAEKCLYQYSATEIERSDVLTPTLVRVLSYYILFGYSSDTREMVCRDLKMRKSYVDNTNCKLRKYGYLVDPYESKSMRKLSRKMEDISDYIKSVIKDGSTPAIVFTFEYKAREPKNYF